MGSGASIPFKSVAEAIAAGKTQEEIDKYLAKNKQEVSQLEMVKGLVESLPTSLGKPEAGAFFDKLTACVIQGEEKVASDKFLAAVAAHLSPRKDKEQEIRDQAAKIRQLKLQIKQLKPGHAKPDVSKLPKHLLDFDPLKTTPGVMKANDAELEECLSKFVQMAIGKDLDAAQDAVAEAEAAKQGVKDAEVALNLAKQRAAKASAAAAAAVRLTKNKHGSKDKDEQSDLVSRLKVKIDALVSAYKNEIPASKKNGWFRRCHLAIVAGNNAFRDIYDKVWFSIISPGETDGIEAYATATKKLASQLHNRAARDVTTQQRTGDLLELYKDAARAKSCFERVVTSVIDQCQDAAVQAAGGEEAMRLQFTLLFAPGLKKVARIVEKSQLRPGACGNVSNVRDVVRAMVIVPNMTRAAEIVEILISCDGILVVVRFKERFIAHPSAGGWRDLMVNFYCVDDPAKHICEIQIVHEMMLQARRGLPGHVVYGRVRNAMELVVHDRGVHAAAESLALADFIDAVGPGKIIDRQTAVESSGSSSAYQSHVSGYEDYLEDKGWLSDAPLGQWERVTTSKVAPGGVERVTGLDLRNLELQGTIPTSFGVALSAAETLNFTNNPGLGLDKMGLQLDPTTKEPHFVTRTTCASALTVLAMPPEAREERRQRMELVNRYGTPDAPALQHLHQSGINNTITEGIRWFEESSGDDVAKWSGITVEVGADGLKRVVGLFFAHLDAAAITALVPGLKILTGLTSLDLSNNELGPAGITALVPALKMLTALTTLDLFNNNLGLAAMTALVPALKILTRLTTLNLGDNNLGPAAMTALVPALKILTRLTTLNLGGNKGNKLGPAGITALVPALNMLTRLTTLDLSNNKLGPAGITALVPGLKMLTALTTLNLDNNKLGPAGITALVPALNILTGLTTLNLGGNKLGPAGITALVPALKILTGLTTLILYYNELGAAGITALVPALKMLTRLTTLDLFNNKLGAAAITALVPGLKMLTGLTTLNLMCNELGPAGMTALVPGLKVLTALTTLDLFNNGLDAAAMTALVPGLKMLTALTTLVLNANKLGPAGMTALVPALKTLTGLTTLDLGYNKLGPAAITALVPGLKMLTALTTLDLSSNELGPAGITALVPALKMLTALTTLNLRGNKLDAAAITALVPALKTLTGLTTLDLGYNNLFKDDKSELKTKFQGIKDLKITL